ncbi:MAG: extracellular solute-binding protein [Alphaproteobacteria bacterium]|jgi:putative spermidine/putrescine transport system substrate-binding protein|nr:extracellular solute-binding protein [Alphaproteobacteria bacterium]
MRRPECLLWLFAAWLLAAGPGSGAAAEEDRRLTVVTWGGAYEAAQRAALFAPFTAATGVRIDIVRYDGGVAALRDHLAAGGAPDWDVIDMIRADARTACAAGLLEPLDPAIPAPAPDGTPAAADFIDGAFGDCFISQLVFATVIAYDDRAFPGEKPDSIADFFDLERFPGRRALRAEPVGLLDWALRAYGVPRSQIYDLLSTERGFRLAFRRLDTIRDSLVWWRGGDEPVRLLTEGAVAMASGYNGRFFHAQVMGGAPISVIWDSALLEHNTWAIPAGTPDRDLAARFIRYATSAGRLAALANRISYGPARLSAQRRVGLHVPTGIPMRPHLPTASRHRALALEKDDAWYARTEALRRRRFEAWLAEGEDRGAAAPSD